MPRKYTKWDDASKSKMRSLRHKGYTMEQIRDSFSDPQPHYQTVSDAVKGIPQGKPKGPSVKQAAHIKKRNKRQALDDRQRNKIVASDETRERVRVLAMPTSATGINVYTKHIDSALIGSARAVFDTWLIDTRTGRLITVPTVERAKATIVLASSYGVWSWESFASDRSQWAGIRELAGVSADAFSDRAGVSSASIGRYESAKRNPDASVARMLHELYRDVQEEAIVRAELILVTSSYADAHETSHDDEIDLDDLYDWVAQGHDLEGFTISHITHLASIRNLLPYPKWRTPQPSNWFLSGYVNIREHVHA